MTNARATGTQHVSFPHDDTRPSAMSRVLRGGKKTTRVRAGSTEVSIYESLVRQRKRFTLAFHRGGVRQRRTFANLEKAKVEAKRVAASLQNGLHEGTDLTHADVAPAAQYETVSPDELSKVRRS